MKEVWKPVVGWEDNYEVSNSGKVRSFDRYMKYPSGALVFKKGRILSTPANTGGYPCSSFSLNDRKQSFRVHQEMARAFIPNPKNLPNVNHKDGIKHNNVLSNLEWVTCSENQLHSYRIGLRPHGKGVLNGNVKLTPKEVLKIRKLREKGMSSRKINKLFPHITRRTIMNIYLKCSWTHI